MNCPNAALIAGGAAAVFALMSGAELRGRLGYTGVTITDAIEAGALADFGGSGERALLSAQAGMDLILCSARDWQQGVDALDALTAAIDDKTLNPGHLKQSLRRVQSLRVGLF